MRMLIRGLFLVTAVTLALAGCASGGGRGQGPVQSFALTAAANPGFPQTILGVIDERQEPKVISVVVPPGSSLGGLVATLSLKTEAVITVVSTGTRVVQMNGSTPNDFSVPVLYSIEVPGDKKAWRYTVTVRQADTEARLTKVSFPDGYILVPAFSPSVSRYSVDVPYASSSVRLDLRAMSPWLKNMSVAGASSAGPAAVIAVPFAAGPQLSVRIETLAEDGVSHAAYEIVVRRAAPDSNSALAGLEVADASLTPVFNPGLSGYQAEVPYSAKSVVVRAWPQSRLSAVALAAADQGQAAAVPLRASGDPSSKTGAQLDFSGVDAVALTLTVTAQDGSVQQYALNIVRGEPDHNYFLGALAIDNSQLGPAFAPNVYAYKATVPFAARQLTVRARASSARASTVLEIAPPVRGAAAPASSGDISSPPGATVDFPSGDSLNLRVVVTAEDGNALRYNLLVVRGAPDRNADLQSLTPSAGLMQPAFSSRIASYVIHLPANVEGVQLSAAAASPVAKISVIEQPAVKAAQNQTVTIPVGAGETTVASLTVTAEDGSQRLYRVQVSREALLPAPQNPPAQNPPAPVSPAQVPPAQVPPAQVPPQQNPPPAGANAGKVPEKPVAMTSHIVVAARSLRLPDAAWAELSAKGEAVMEQARITVRYYRTDAVLLQGTAHVDMRQQGANMTLSLAYKSAEIALDRRNLVEIEVAVPTSANRYLYYSEARPVDDDMSVEPSYLLLGKDSRAAWPAPGSPVNVAGYYSSAREDKDQPAAAIVLEISDPATGKLLAREVVSSRGHWRQGTLASFGQPLVLAEGATVRYALQGQARGGVARQSSGTAHVWTVGRDPLGGTAQAVMFGVDDSSPVKQPGSDQDKDKVKKN